MENFNKFWISFREWYEKKIAYSNLLKSNCLQYYNWDGGIYEVHIDFDSLFKLHYGIIWKDIFKINNINNDNIEEWTCAFKQFIELLYNNCVENRYQFTIVVNDKLKKFNIPYQLQSGKFLKREYRTSEKQNNKIINSEMCEDKIGFALEKILCDELQEKKAALCYIVDVLQYLLSIDGDEKAPQKRLHVAKVVAGNNTGKIYTIVESEIKEIMKISNEYFDIRHNEQYNKAKEKREVLNTSFFIEYLFNRVYALVHIIRLRHKPKTESSENIPNTTTS